LKEEGEAGQTTRQHGTDEGSSAGGAATPSAGANTPTGAAGFKVAHGDNSIPEYGSEADASTRARARESLRAYLEARESEEWAGACSHMAAPVQRQLKVLATGREKKEETSCEAAFAQLASFGSSGARQNPLIGGLASFRVEGEKAFALFYGPGEHQYMMPMVSEGGEWLVNLIGPVPYPPGAPGGE
jgi:hypothetical protein